MLIIHCFSKKHGLSLITKNSTTRNSDDTVELQTWRPGMKRTSVHQKITHFALFVLEKKILKDRHRKMRKTNYFEFSYTDDMGFHRNLGIHSMEKIEKYNDRQFWTELSCHI